jgi:hypothetical protein
MNLKFGLVLSVIFGILNPDLPEILEHLVALYLILGILCVST